MLNLIPRTGPRIIRRKGRKFWSYTPGRMHGVVFRELWVLSLHPRLGCFSESDLRGDLPPGTPPLPIYFSIK